MQWVMMVTVILIIVKHVARVSVIINVWPTRRIYDARRLQMTRIRVGAVGEQIGIAPSTHRIAQAVDGQIIGELATAHRARIRQVLTRI